MLLGVATVLLSPEPARPELPPARKAIESLESALVGPLADFLRRYGKQAGLILPSDGDLPYQRVSECAASPFRLTRGSSQKNSPMAGTIARVVIQKYGA